MSANSSICLRLGTLWSSMRTLSTRPWKNEVSYVFSLHRLNILYLRETGGIRSEVILGLPNLSLCFVSKKAATFSIGFLSRTESFTENLLNRKTDRMHSNVKSRMLKRTIFRIVCELLTATKHTMQELKPVERPDSGTGEAGGNHPVGHISQVQVKPILLVPGKKGIKSEVTFLLIFTSSCSVR